MKSVIAPQTGVGFILKKNQVLFVADPQGQQVADLFCVSLNNRTEILSCARSMDYADSILLTSASQLYSNRSQVMLEILEDSCGRHDLLMPPCSLKMFQIVAQNNDYHPSCHENLTKQLEPFGISADQIHNTFNIFMNVQVTDQGQLSIRPSLSKKDDVIAFRAHMDLIVGLTACSHEETNLGSFGAIHFWITDDI